MDYPSPTDAEFEILRVLWARGAATVREVHEIIAKTNPVGYTTVLKQMQRMSTKGLLKRSERFRSHVYEPAQPQDQVQRRLTAAILSQVFGGSARELLQSALAGRKVSRQELQDIRDVLASYDRKIKP
jgi:predicted transcriptional regulator